MFKRLWGKHVKNQRGLTLIELLATIVILGIISAIAVPSIGGLITGSKKDAAISNAQQAVNAAKIYVATHSTQMTFDANNKATLNLETLINDGQLEPVKNPMTGQNYASDGIVVEVEKTTTGYNYKVKLSAHKDNAPFKYVSDLTRDDVAK
jgi:type IV pilus assembly protein PilA